MTLSRKILLCDVALMCGLLALGVVSLCGLRALQRHQDTTTNEYAELRRVEATNVHLASALAMMQASTPDPARATSELRAALEQVQQLQVLQEEGPASSVGHEKAEAQTIQRTLTRLHQVIDDLANAPTAASLLSGASVLDQIRGDLDALTERSEDLVETSQHRTTAGVRDTSLAIVVSFAAIAIIAVFISISQYRSIMRPLRALRDGVRQISSGRFDQRLRVSGSQEFVQLADDFNRMAAELDELYRDLEQKVAAKSRELVQSERLASVGFLAAGVAHEINNPLGIMSGFAELSLKRLRQHPDDPAAIGDAQRTLQIIRDEAFRCREITSKLLNLAKGGGTHTRSRVSLAAVVHDVIDMLKAHPRYRQRTMLMDCGVDELIVVADESEMKQALLNLITNALEAVDDSPAGVVRVNGRSDGRGVELCVEDNGCGMSGEVLSRAFEPFFSARKSSDSQSRSGIGLGLSLTHAIVESHGGTIRAESDGAGKGSRFVIRFPGVTAVDRDVKDQEAVNA